MILRLSEFYLLNDTRLAHSPGFIRSEGFQLFPFSRKRHLKRNPSPIPGCGLDLQLTADAQSAFPHADQSHLARCFRTRLFGIKSDSIIFDGQAQPGEFHAHMDKDVLGLRMCRNIVERFLGNAKSRDFDFGGQVAGLSGNLDRATDLVLFLKARRDRFQSWDQTVHVEDRRAQAEDDAAVFGFNFTEK